MRALPKPVRCAEGSTPMPLRYQHRPGGLSAASTRARACRRRQAGMPSRTGRSPEAGPQQRQSAVLGFLGRTPDSDAQHGITGSTMGDVHGSAGVEASADGCSPDPGQSCLPLRVVGKEERVGGSIREGVGHDPRGGRDLVRAYPGDEGPSHEEFYLIRPRKRCKRARPRPHPQRKTCGNRFSELSRRHW